MNCSEMNELFPYPLNLAFPSDPCSIFFSIFPLLSSIPTQLSGFVLIKTKILVQGGLLGFSFAVCKIHCTKEGSYDLVSVLV